MIIWVLSAITILFLLLVFTRQKIKKWFNLNLCAICSAVSITWITLLILKYLGFVVNDLLIGILMGESVTGIMYLFEKQAKQKSKNNLLWFKIIIILLGTFFVYSLLSNANLIIISSTLILIFILFLLIRAEFNSTKKNTTQKLPEKLGKYSKEIKKLEEQFEHCCD